MNFGTDLSGTSSIQRSSYPQTDVTSVPVSPRAGAALTGLTSGQTFQAEVVSRDGNEVALRLANGETVSAKLGSDIPLEPGKMLTFEVRQSGQTVSVSPLQTNLSADPNAVRALQMANLPVSASSVEMTTLMMKAGMSIDRTSLQQMLSRITQNPGAGAADVIDLTRLGMKVTPENLEQLNAYKNLSYQIEDGMREVASKLNDSLMQLTGSGDTANASALMQRLLETAAAFEGEPAAEVPGTVQELPQTESQTGMPGSAPEGVQSETAKEIPGAATESAPAGSMAGIPGSTPETAQTGNAGEATGNVPDTASEAAQAGSAGQVSEAAPESSAASRALELLRAMGQASAQETDQTSQQGALRPGSETETQPGRQAAAANPASAADPASGARGAQMQSQLPADGAPQTQQTIPAQLPLPDEQPAHAARLAEDLSRLAQSDPELAQQIREETGERPLTDLSAGELLRLSSSLLAKASASGNDRAAQALLGNSSLKNTLFATLQKQWSIEPKDVARKEEVQDLYRRLDTQLTAIRGALESAGMQKSEAFQASSNMNQNLDFLNQLNQMYAYVQLPLHLDGRETGHGDLYVYSNGKKLSSKDGSVSALLHLDMEHLGPVDVYASLNLNGPSQKVTTQFYVQDDEILDFLEAHMDLLTARLEKRGYACSCKMTVRGASEDPRAKAAESGGVNVLLAHLGGGIRYSGSSFDART